MQYNKLVRDNIPEIIERSGKKPIYRILDDAEYIEALERKLDEEVAEFHESKSLEELADICDVVYALVYALGVDYMELIKARITKQGERGGFYEKLFLIEVKEK